MTSRPLPQGIIKLAQTNTVVRAFAHLHEVGRLTSTEALAGMVQELVKIDALRAEALTKALTYAPIIVYSGYPPAEAEPDASDVVESAAREVTRLCQVPATLLRPPRETAHVHHPPDRPPAAPRPRPDDGPRAARR